MRLPVKTHRVPEVVLAVGEDIPGRRHCQPAVGRSEAGGAEREQADARQHGGPAAGIPAAALAASAAHPAV